VKKRLSVEDATMAFQWLVTIVLTPFVLIPAFSDTPGSFYSRLIIVLTAFGYSAVMTAIYMRERKRSKVWANRIVNITATFDVILVFVAMLLWPLYLPDLFWIFAILVIVVATRFGYKDTILATLGLSALYAITIVARFGHGTPAGTVVANTLLKIVLLLIVVAATVYITQREKREQHDARVLSKVAGAIGSKLEVDDLLQAVVDGMSEAAELGRTTIYMISGDGRWALPKCSTEKDPEVRENLSKRPIDLRANNVAAKVVETGEKILLEDVRESSLIDKRWLRSFDLGSLLVMPFKVRDEVKGIVFVERRRPKGLFDEREIEICETILAQATTGFENASRYAEEQKKRSEYDLLYHSSRELGSTLDLVRVAENACMLAISSAEATSCTAFLVEDGRGVMQPRVSVKTDGSKSTSFPTGSGVKVTDVEHVMSLAQRPPALLISNPGGSAAIPPFLRDAGTVLLVPFYAHSRLSGMLTLCDESSRSFDETQLSRISAVAGETGLALLNATLYEQIKADAAQMASLIQLANSVGTTSDMQTITGIALDSVRHLFDCTSALIYRVDEKDQTLTYVESFGYHEDILGSIASPPYMGVKDCWTCAEGRLIGIDDLSNNPVQCRTLERIGLGSTICVGMQVEGRTLGVLHVYSERPNAFGEQDQQLAMAIADQLAVALQRSILFEQINRMAITDPLTGVFNVRRLEEVLADELSRARRYSRSVSFLMVDVDNLKIYNDTLGHQHGDRVLSQIAAILSTQTRDVDKVFRYGGDEFCVVLPETEGPEAMVVAEKVRRAIDEFSFAGEAAARPVTISAGVASFPLDSDDETSLVRCADTALYEAKQKGRNKVLRFGRS